MQRRTDRTDRQSDRSLRTPTPGRRQPLPHPHDSTPTWERGTGRPRRAHRAAQRDRPLGGQRGSPHLPRPADRHPRQPTSPPEDPTPATTLLTRSRRPLTRVRRSGRNPLPALAMCVLHAVPTAAAASTPNVAEAASPGVNAGQIAGPATPASDRSWPVTGPSGTPPELLRGWEPPPTPWAAGHRGVDLAAAEGTAVRAAAPGQITFAGTVAGRGVLTIEVSDSGRPPLHTTYEPIRATVHKGQHVTAGQPVGLLEDGPYHCREPCLHWGLLRGTTYLDPLSLLPPTALRKGPSRLLPVFDVPEPQSVPVSGLIHPHPEQPAPTAHVAQDSPPDTTSAALLGAITLTATTLWALGRLHRGPRRRRTARRHGPAIGASNWRRRTSRTGHGTTREEERAQRREETPTRTA
ncbi:peptidoglycan DD-metalloendopeptidase family protein [Streptomyces noursei]|uniref:murein hydrolase activator EnvC family protein n=1 Tax=Streptomyces noursei TaxID=1971 RepID=UPI003EBCB14E